MRLIHDHLAGHLRQLPAPDGRQSTRFHVAQRLRIDQKAPRPVVGQHVDDGQAVLGGRREVGRIERVADDVAVPVLPIHPGARVVQMLPGATGQPRLVEGLFLGVEGGLVFDQEVRHLPVGDPHPHTAQQLGHLRLAHLGPISRTPAPGS